MPTLLQKQKNACTEIVIPLSPCYKQYPGICARLVLKGTDVMQQCSYDLVTKTALKDLNLD